MCTVLGVIMEYRRRQKGDYYNSRDPSRRRSLKKKPPRCMWKFLIYSNCQIVWFFFFFNNNFPNLMYDRLFFPFFENCFLIMSFVLFFSSMIWVAVALMNWKQIVLISMHVLKPNISWLVLCFSLIFPEEVCVFQFWCCALLMETSCWNDMFAKCSTCWIGVWIRINSASKAEQWWVLKKVQSLCYIYIWYKIVLILCKS